MKKRAGIFIAALGLMAMSYFPIGLASVIIAEYIGGIIAPRQDHVLIGMACIGAGCGLVVLLILGMIVRSRAAFRISALVFLADMAAFIGVHLRAGDYQSWSERTFGLVVAVVCLLAALYVWRLSWQPPQLSQNDTQAF